MFYSMGEHTKSTKNGISHHNTTFTSNEIESCTYLRHVYNQNSRRWYIRFVCLFNFMIFDVPKKASIAVKCFGFCYLVHTNWFYAQFYCSTNINTRDASVFLSFSVFKDCVRTVRTLACRTSVSQCHKTRTFTFYCVVDKRTSNRTLFTIWFLLFFCCGSFYSVGTKQNQHIQFFV